MHGVSSNQRSGRKMRGSRGYLKYDLIIWGHGKIGIKDQVTRCLDTCVVRMKFGTGYGVGEMQHGRKEKVQEQNCNVLH